MMVALVSVDRYISPVLVCVISGYRLGTNISQVSKLKYIFFSFLLVNR